MKARTRARITRFVIFGIVLLVGGYFLNLGSNGTPVPPKKLKQGPETVGVQKFPVKPGPKIKATLVSLARNGDLNGILNAVRNVEDRFNRKFHYDWVFLNEVPFSQEFIDLTTAHVSGTTKYGLIPAEHWGYPDWIDQDRAKKSREKMVEDKVIYGGSESYRHMCRYESGFFFRHPLMDEYDYYWRVDPDIKLYCDIDYDIFKFMSDNKKRYAFTVAIPEFVQTIPTLWKTVKEFIGKNSQYIVPNNLRDFISNDGGDTYNLCHFWSNFEIADLNFFRSEAYLKYFEYLDKSGGFFYERWGDAPVHTIAVALFMDRNDVHFFDDIGYFHAPYHNCPKDPEVRKNKNCLCEPGTDVTWKRFSCVRNFYSPLGLPIPEGK